MFDYANQFKNADMIVIAAPHWDCGFPAILKTYIEAIGVMGIVYKYIEDGFDIMTNNPERLIQKTIEGLSQKIISKEDEL